MWEPSIQRNGWHKAGATHSSRWTQGGEAARKGEDKRKGAGPLSPGHSAVSLYPVCALAPRQCGWVGCLRLAAAMPAQVVALRHTKARGCQQPPPPRHPGFLLEKFFLPLHERGRCKESFTMREWEVREDRNSSPSFGRLIYTWGNTSSQTEVVGAGVGVSGAPQDGETLVLI